MGSFATLETLKHLLLNLLEPPGNGASNEIARLNPKVERGSFDPLQHRLRNPHSGGWLRFSRASHASQVSDHFKLLYYQNTLQNKCHKCKSENCVFLCLHFCDRNPNVTSRQERRRRTRTTRRRREMNAMQSFFKKYHAVPATNDGPQWRNATTEALIGWADGDCKTWDENVDSRSHIAANMVDVGNELYQRWLAGAHANQSDAIHALNASHKIFRRIGYDRRVEAAR